MVGQMKDCQKKSVVSLVNIKLFMTALNEAM
jgi:hypothetical protein